MVCSVLCSFSFITYLILNNNRASPSTSVTCVAYKSVISATAEGRGNLSLSPCNLHRQGVLLWHPCNCLNYLLFSVFEQ